MSRRPERHRPATTRRAAAGRMALAATCVLAMAACAPDGGSGSAEEGPVIDRANVATSVDGPGAPATPTSAPQNDACHTVHAGHDVMHWTAVAADEMLAAGCAWPYAGFAPTMVGGASDPALDEAPFTGRPYSDIVTLMGRLGLGLCAFGNTADPGPAGFVFGFEYHVAPPGCPGADDAAAVRVAEYSTRGHRDGAAHDLASPGTFVLGRWVVTVDGPDPDVTSELIVGLHDLGALPVATA